LLASPWTLPWSAVGTNGALRVTDFVFPFDEKSAGFSVLASPAVAELAVGWGPPPAERTDATDLPQEALMVREFARLVKDVRDAGRWPARGQVARHHQEDADFFLFYIFKK